MKKIILILTISLLLAAGVTMGKFMLLRHVMPHANYGMQAICSQSHVSKLFIGSSMFRKGIYCPDYGDDTYLLAYNGNQPALEALQLEYLLNHGAKIDHVIIDMYPYSAVRPASLSDTRQLMDADWRYVYRLYDRISNTEQNDAEVLFKMFVQSNNELLFTWPISYPLTNSRYTRGANGNDVPGCTTAFLDQAEAEEMKVMDRTLHEDQKKGLEQIIGLCRNHHLKLTFLETPKYAKVYDDEVFCAIMREYTRYLTQLHQQLILCDKTYDLCRDQLTDDAQVSTYPFDYQDAACFNDLIHLSSKGRERLSAEVGLLLRYEPLSCRR